MNTKHIGDISESMVIAAFLHKGITVGKMFGDNAAYDLIADLDGLKRIQVKTVRLKENVIKVPNYTSFTHRGYGVSLYTSKDIDYLAAYEQTLKAMYLIPISVLEGNKYLTLRFELTKNNQSKSVNYAVDYLFFDFNS